MHAYISGDAAYLLYDKKEYEKIGDKCQPCCVGAVSTRDDHRYYRVVVYCFTGEIAILDEAVGADKLGSHVPRCPSLEVIQMQLKNGTIPTRHTHASHVQFIHTH